MNILMADTVFLGEDLFDILLAHRDDFALLLHENHSPFQNVNVQSSAIVFSQNKNKKIRV